MKLGIRKEKKPRTIAEKSPNVYVTSTALCKMEVRFMFLKSCSFVQESIPDTLVSFTVGMVVMRKRMFRTFKAWPDIIFHD